MSTSKSKKRVDDPGQLTIYDAISASTTEKQDDCGSMRIVDALKSALNVALKRSPLSRHQVAGQMSHLLNEEISKAMIDSWTAESKTDRHIPAEYIPAFCKATGSNLPLEVLLKKTGLFVVNGPDALEIELQRLRREMDRLQNEIVNRERLLHHHHRAKGATC